MSDWQLDDDDESGQQGGKDPVRAQLRKLEKELKEEREARQKAEATARTSSIKDILSEHKLPTKLSALIPSSVDANPDAIKAWVEEYKDLFSIKTQDETPPGDQSGQPNNAGQVLTPEMQDLAYVNMVNAMSRMNNATTGGTVPQSKPEDQLQTILSPDLKYEDLVKMIEQAGGGIGAG